MHLPQVPECRLAQARNKRAYVRVGGGEVFYSVLSAVETNNWWFWYLFNYTSLFISGGAGSVGAAGG